MDAAAVTTKTRAGVGALVRAGMAAAGVAAVVNGLLFLAGSALGAFPETAIVPQRGGPLTLMPILTLSIGAPMVGAGLYAALRRFTDRAFVVFLAIAAAVFAVMAGPPFQIENVPVAQIVLLETMHLVTAAATILALVRAERS